MNELDQLARLRDEVPLDSSPALAESIVARLTQDRPSHSARQARPSHSVRPPRGVRRWGMRPVIAGALALTIGGGTALGVTLTQSASHPAPPASGQPFSWSGRPTAAWPPAGSRYGTATTAAELIQDATRAAAASPGRAPRPGEWVVVRTEQADSSAGSGGFLFGPPDERSVHLQWRRADGCAATQDLVFKANLAPAATVSGTLKVTLNPDYVYGGQRNCLPSLTGWTNTTYAYLNSLPTDPAALEKVLLANNPPGGLTPTRSDAVFTAISTLLADGQPDGVVVPRPLEAAFYQVLLRLPGVHFERSTDLAGRTGLGFWIETEGYLKQEIVIDPASYRYLGYKDVAVKAHTDTALDGTRHIKAGQVLGWAALLGTAIVAHPGQTP